MVFLFVAFLFLFAVSLFLFTAFPLLKLYSSINLADLAPDGTSSLQFAAVMRLAFLSCGARKEEELISKEVAFKALVIL